MIDIGMRWPPYLTDVRQRASPNSPEGEVWGLGIGHRPGSTRTRRSDLPSDGTLWPPSRAGRQAESRRSPLTCKKGYKKSVLMKGRLQSLWLVVPRVATVRDLPVRGPAARRPVGDQGDTSNGAAHEAGSLAPRATDRPLSPKARPSLGSPGRGSEGPRGAHRRDGHEPD